MIRHSRRWIAVLLSLVLALPALPAAAFHAQSDDCCGAGNASLCAERIETRPSGGDAGAAAARCCASHDAVLHQGEKQSQPPDGTACSFCVLTAVPPPGIASSAPNSAEPRPTAYIRAPHTPLAVPAPPVNRVERPPDSHFL